MRGNFGDIEERALYNFAGDNFDAENFDAENFDADNFAKARGQVARPRQRARSNFDLTMVNNGAVALKIELFNELNSFVDKQRTEFITGDYTYIPLSAAPTTAGGAGTVGFLNDGSLYVRGLNTATQLTVSCNQFPYKGLLKASGKGRGFTIVSIRQTTSSDGQIDNEIVHTRNTFLGKKEENRITPRTYFRPEQFQAKIVDIPLNAPISSEHGFVYTLNAGETVKWNIVIER